MNALFDTSFVIKLLDANRAAETHYAMFDAGWINLTTLGELLAGGDLDHFLQHVGVLGLTTTTATHYAEILRSLEKTGLRIQQNDIWIAATAIEHDLTLLTFDRHFERVDGLKRVIL